MKNNKMTRDEKRRLLLSKNHELSYRLDNDKLPNGDAHILVDNTCATKTLQSRNRRVLAIVLAVIFLFSGLFSLLVSALDGKGYDEISTEIFSGTENTYTVPSEGVARGTWMKYSRDGKQYVFQTQYDLAPGDILTLQDNDTNDTIVIDHDPTRGAENLTNHATLTSSGSAPYTFTLNPGSATYEDGVVTGYQDNVLKAGQRYYYTPDGGTTYYTFTPAEDIGYEWIETREQGVYTQKTLGDLTITIDPTATDPDQQFSVLGNKYTRKVIYERTDTLLPNHVYLITAATNAGEQEHLLTYGATKEEKTWIRIWDNASTSGGLTPDCPSWAHNTLFGYGNPYNYKDPFGVMGSTTTGKGEYVYNQAARDVVQVDSAPEETALSPTLIVSSPTEESSKFYDYIPSNTGSLSDQMLPTQHHYYFDGADGSLPEENQKYSTNDIYVLSEFSTYTKNLRSTFVTFLAQLIGGAESGGTLLMGYDWDGSSFTRDKETVNESVKGYYTSGKALGSQFSASINPQPAAQLLVHELCDETTMRISHAYGGLWHYDSTNLSLYNSNSQAFDAAPRFFDYDPSYSTKCYGDGDTTITVDYHLENTANSRTSKATYLYVMKDVYTHESIDQHRSITAETKGHTQVDATELEDVTVTLSYDGSNVENPDAEFEVKFTLTDDSQARVSGNWSTDELTFTDDGFKKNMKNGDSIPFTNIPKGYSLNVSVALPDGSDDNVLYYSFTIDGQPGTEQSFDINDDKNILIAITPIKEKVTITNYTNDPEGQSFSDKTKKFPLKLTLYESDGQTPFSGVFAGTDGTTYTFDEYGVCTNTVELADQESVSLFLPKNTVLKVEDAETASGYTTTYSDPTANDSSNPLNTSISNDGIQITVKHTADEIVITGLLEESETQGLAIGGAVASVGLAAGVAYVYCKKDEII